MRHNTDGPKRACPQLFRGAALIASLGFFLSVARAHALTLSGVDVEPGALIALHGGKAADWTLSKYGHAALYLGVDPWTKKDTFLDFSYQSGYPIDRTSEPFFARIRTLHKFLEENGKVHDSFNVFRLKDGSRADTDAMLKAARKVAGKTYLRNLVCTQAAVSVLSAGIGRPILIGDPRPDSVVYNYFERYPGLEYPIAIQDTLEELDRPAREARQDGLTIPVCLRACDDHVLYYSIQGAAKQLARAKISAAHKGRVVDDVAILFDAHYTEAEEEAAARDIDLAAIDIQFERMTEKLDEAEDRLAEEDREQAELERKKEALREWRSGARQRASSQSYSSGNSDDHSYTFHFHSATRDYLSGGHFGSNL